MKFLLVLALCIIATNAAKTIEEILEENGIDPDRLAPNHYVATKDDECVGASFWAEYKKLYEISFSSSEKEKVACRTFNKNVQVLAAQNKQRSDRTYTIGITSVMHVEHDNNSTDYRGLKLPIEMHHHEDGEDHEHSDDEDDHDHHHHKRASLPASFDWRKVTVKGKTWTPNVKHQGECGSCYSFSAAGALEGQYFKCTGNSVSFSEQFYLDCSPKTGGCGGGDPNGVASLAISKSIPFTSSSYPYNLGGCNEKEWAVRKYPDCYSRVSCSASGFKIKSMKPVQRYSEEALLRTLVEVGPVQVVVNAINTFMTYKSGIYNGHDSRGPSYNHAVLLVGYDRDSLIIKNSWGTGWGEGGYMRLARNGGRYGTSAILSYSQAPDAGC